MEPECFRYFGETDMEAIIPIIIQAVSGMAGGGVAATIMKQAAMSLLPKLLAGGIGGIAGGSALGGIIGSAIGGDPAGGMDIGSIIGDVVGGAAGGGVLTGLAGMFMGKK